VPVDEAAPICDVDAAAPIADTYRFLLGEWRIERALTDHRLHETGLFRGTATVAPCEIGFRPAAQYREVGQLRFGTYRGTASRSLRYLREQDGAVTVTFEDGRRFVACDLRSGRCDGTHVCGEDQYEVSWRVVAHDVLVERWRARGPCKDYEARCVLSRLRGSGHERSS
jgi:hypothetical protein